MKKATLFLLILAMLTASFASCGDSSKDETTKETNTTTIQTDDPAKETTAIEARQAISDDLPEKDFGGQDFIVITNEGYETYYLVAEEQTGEGVNDAIYARNLTVDERYNAKVAVTFGGTHRETATMVANTITAGDSDAFDLIQFHVVANSGNTLKGLYMNWYDVPYIDFEKPWWSDSIIDNLTINKHTFLAMGDFALTTIAGTYCMFYDKEEAVNYQVDNLYQVVKDGKWTLDYLRELCEKVYTDTNGNGEADEDDYYGMSTDQQSNLNTYLWACGNQIFAPNAAGEPEYNYFTEHLVDTYSACYDLINNTEGVFSKMDHEYGVTMFANYKTLTCNAQLGRAITSLSEFEHEYGIIPYPKYDENQSEYRTMVDGYHEAMAVGKNAIDLEFIGVMTEVLCAESYKQVMPAYYDVCLKQRYASSAEDAEMIDLCVASRVFDIGYVYDNWQGVSFYLEQLLRDTSGQDITSFYAKKEKAAVKYYNEVVALFTDAE